MVLIHFWFVVLGLLQQLKTPSPTFKGTDLTSLGLNLSSSESLYSSFASPFSKAETEYKIPKCYHMMPKIPSPHDKMSLFSDETLFYIFYRLSRVSLVWYFSFDLACPGIRCSFQLPKSLKLASGAIILNCRFGFSDWPVSLFPLRFLIKSASPPLRLSLVGWCLLAGTTANKTQNFELGSYVYFDIKQWGKIRKANFKVEYMKLWS